MLAPSQGCEQSWCEHVPRLWPHLTGLPRVHKALPCPTQELVRILHKALEAAQQEKRASCAYLAAAEDKDRLELVRHKVRQITALGRRVEALEQERDSLAQAASLREQQVQELQQHVQLLMDKNQAKQQVICVLSEKVTQDFMQPPQQPPGPPGAADRDFLSHQEKMEHLKVRDPWGGHCSRPERFSR